MRVFLRRFWILLPTFAGVAGLAVAAASLKKLWVFWVVLGLAVLVAAAPQAGPRMLDVANRIRNYPSLLRSLTELQDRREQLEQRVRLLSSESEAAFTRGVVEGRQQVVGFLRARSVKTPPRLTSTSIVGNEPVLIAECEAGDMAPLGSRFVLEVRGSGEVKGIVQVVAVNEEERVVTLACAEARVQEFWLRLEEQALADASPPAGVVLRPTTVESLTDGDQAVGGALQQEATGE